MMFKGENKRTMVNDDTENEKRDGKKKKMDQTDENVTILAQKGDIFEPLGGLGLKSTGKKLSPKSTRGSNEVEIYSDSNGKNNCYSNGSKSTGNDSKGSYFSDSNSDHNCYSNDRNIPNATLRIISKLNLLKKVYK